MEPGQGILGPKDYISDMKHIYNVINHLIILLFSHLNTWANCTHSNPPNSKFNAIYN